jgi:hypothetical protein
LSDQAGNDLIRCALFWQPLPEAPWQMLLNRFDQTAHLRRAAHAPARQQV